MVCASANPCVGGEDRLGAIHTGNALNQLGPGNSVTIAFKLPLPADNVSPFEQAFQDLLASPNFTVITGGF